MLNREENQEEIYEVVRLLTKGDMRVGQVFSNLSKRFEQKGKQLYFVENDVLLKEIKEFAVECGVLEEETQS